jgi:hypothetical protein
MKYISYNTPACPGCGGDNSKGFTTHLEVNSALPGAAGQYDCHLCGFKINYILSEQVTVDVLPYKGKPCNSQS